jgi:hypothetical protein
VKPPLTLEKVGEQTKKLPETTATPTLKASDPEGRTVLVVVVPSGAHVTEREAVPLAIWPALTF